MRKAIKIIAAAALLGSLTIQAAPDKTFDWTAPTLYENGQSIPAGDLTNYTLHCGTAAGGPYPVSRAFSSQSPPSLEDMAFVVQGQPGTYFCVSTVESAAHGTTSGFSNEVNFSVSPADLGFVPQAPVLVLQ